MFKRCLTILIAPLFVLGCGEEPTIQRYEVTAPVGFNWPASELREGDVEIDGYDWAWDIPAGWIDAPEVPDQLLADYRFKGSTASLPGRTTVTKIDGDAGGVNANVMRWLGQIFVTEARQIGPKDSVTGPIPSPIGLGEITFADLHGQYQGEHMPSRIYAAIVQIPADGGGVFQTWVFKLAGDDATVQANRAGLAQMALTFRPKDIPRPDLPGLAPINKAESQTQDANETP